MPEWYLPCSYSLSLATFIDLFFHRTHPKVPPQKFFLGFSLGTPSSLLSAVIIDASPNFHFWHYQSHVHFQPWTSAEFIVPQCLFLKELLYLVGLPPFQNTQKLVHGSWSYRSSLSPPLSPNGELLPWGPTLPRQANNDLWAWLSTVSTMFWCV